LAGGAEDGDFEGAQGAAEIAIGGDGQVVQGVVGDLEVEVAEAAVGAGDGAAKDGDDIVFGEGQELEDLGAGDEGGVDGEEGVFGGGADEGDDAAFDIAEQDVLLGAVEAVDFVEEEDGFPAVVFEAADGVVEDSADIFDADGGGIGAFEVAVGVCGDDFGEAGFAGTRRAVEDHGGEGIGFEHAAQELARAEEVLLAGELVEGAGAQADGEGLGGLAVGIAFLLPESGHVVHGIVGR